MQRKLATSPDTDTVVEAQVIDEKPPQKRREFLVAHPSPSEPAGFIDSRELARRIGCSTGTVANMRASGRLPWVKIPGGRLVRFFWPDVEAALLRASRGGAQ